MCINNTLYAMSSRTCEAAGLRKDQVKLKSEEMFMVKYLVPSVSVERHKTLSHKMDMCFYPHRDSMLQDMLFSLGYHLVLNEHSGGDEYFFPDFAAKINNNKKELDTATGRLFQQYYESIMSIVDRYQDEMDPDEFEEYVFLVPSKYSGHTPKKSSVNKLADNLNIQIFVFRAGWMVKNMHTAFDYIVNTKKKDELCGKVIANWLMKMGDDYVGGVPPSGESIIHKKESYQPFVDELFASQSKLDGDFKKMLTASILRWYEDLVSLVKEEPLGRFKEHYKHPFVARILKAAGDVGLREEDIVEWSKAVKKDFISKNCLAMPMSIVSDAYGQGNSNPTDAYIVDTRPMLQLMKDVSNTSAMTAMHNIRMSNEMNQLTSIVKQQNIMLRDLASEIKELKDFVGVKNKTKLDQNTIVDFCEPWDILDTRLCLNMRMIIFNWYNSDV